MGTGSQVGYPPTVSFFLSLPPSKHQGIEIGTGSQLGYAPAGSLFYRNQRENTRV
jgi:hypothetical protein